MYQLSTTLQSLAQRCKRLDLMYAPLCHMLREKLTLWVDGVAPTIEVGTSQPWTNKIDVFGPSVLAHDNVNLSRAQKELLLWHNKLGISMPRVQELMRSIPMEDPSGASNVAPQVIKPKIPQSSSCPLPTCQSCQMARARQRKPNIVKSKVIQENAGALSHDKYEL